MGEDIEARLVQATARLNQLRTTNDRLTELRTRQRVLDDEVRQLRAALAAEERDVERFEGLSLARILSSLTGARDDRLARERAEADAARLRFADAEARRVAVRRELEATVARRDELASAPAEHQAVLAEKEAHLAQTHDPRGPKLMALAEERGELTGQLPELDEAIEAARTALGALNALSDILRSAGRWSAYDTFGGGGVPSSFFKHARMDEAAQQAAHADRCLATLRTELSDVDGVGTTNVSLDISAPTRFLDTWFDNIFTDLHVHGRIVEAQGNAASCVRRVTKLLDDLGQRAETARRRLETIDRERTDLLTT